MTPAGRRSRTGAATGGRCARRSSACSGEVVLGVARGRPAGHLQLQVKLTLDIGGRGTTVGDRRESAIRGRRAGPGGETRREVGNPGCSRPRVAGGAAPVDRPQFFAAGNGNPPCSCSSSLRGSSWGDARAAARSARGVARPEARPGELPGERDVHPYHRRLRRLDPGSPRLAGGLESRDVLEPPGPEEAPWERSCQHGLREIGIPFVVAGQRLATLFLGHFAYQGEAPSRDPDRLGRELARAAEARAAVSDRVPTFARRAVEEIVAYDMALIRFLAELAERALSQAAERKEAEERLRISEQRLRLGMRAARAAFFDADLEAGELSQDPRFHGWPDLPVLVRGSPEEISAALFSPEDLPRIRETLRPLLDGSADHASVECRRNPRGGRAGWVRCAIAVVERDARGRARRLCGSATEITEWKELQERAMRAERVASVGTLVRGLSHEINNPLASLIANVSYAQRELEAAPPRVREAWTDEPDRLEDLGRALRDASEAAERIRVLVARLRTFTSGHSGESRCELRSAVENALWLTRSELAACAEVSVALPALPEIAAGPLDLAEVLANLLANAGQATGPGPNRVRVTAERRDVARVAVSISDTGTGIDPAIAPRVFDPFFSTRSVGKGAGLGLSVCLGIVRGVGGEITIDSTPGDGTVVTVVLPVAPSPGAKEPT